MSKNYNCKDCEIIRIAKISADSYEYCLHDLEEELKPFQDDYFQGLTKQQIAELAKKSIRLTKENSKLRHALEDIDRRIQLENADDCLLDVKGIIDEVLKC